MKWKTEKRGLMENNKKLNISKLSLRKYIKRIAIVSILMISLISSTTRIHAGMIDNVATYSVVDYDYEMAYKTMGRSMGGGTINIVGSTSKMDKVCIPHVIYTVDCCGNQTINNQCYFEFYLDGNLVYRDTDIKIYPTAESIVFENPYIDVSRYRNANSKMKYVYSMLSARCANCSKLVEPIMAYGGLYFYDYRGKAVFPLSEYNVEAGGGITITPSYNEYADHCVWGIKYPGDSSYTLLKDGENAKGISVTGATAKNISLSSVPPIAGGFDIGLFCYDESGSLPCGHEYPKTCFSTHVTSRDTVLPTLKVDKIIDKENKVVTAIITSSDNYGLHAKPYSWDGGANFGTENKKSFSKAGTYYIAVRDAAGNIQTGSVYISQENIEEASPVPTNTPTQVPTQSPAPTKTPTLVPTQTPVPTKIPTPLPTQTPVPTKMPTPSPTKIPTPIPIAKDTEPPEIKIVKNIDKNRGMVVVTMIGTDNVGLHSTPYSWDGGNTFESANQKGIKTPGKYYVALRDSSNNVQKGSFYVDSIEIEKAIPNPTGAPTPSVPEINPGINSFGEDVMKPTPTPTPTVVPAKSNSDLPDIIKKKEEYVVDGHNSDNPGKKVEIKELETDTISKKKGQNGDTDKLSKSNISDEDSSEMFERIKNNSGEYVISMGERKASNTQAGPLEGSDSVIQIDEDPYSGEEYISDSSDELGSMSMSKKKLSPVCWILIVLCGLILLFVVGFILFFGVVILAEKETEYSVLSGTEGFKIPVAISFIKYKNGDFSVCFRELLEKYGVVYARLGLIFAYMYENERLRITTKHKGEEEIEIATEKIQTELIIGNKGGVAR